MAEAEREILLDVRDLTTTFSTENGTVIAVDNISFRLYRGETLGIVGESGSGKSVTSLSLMQLIPRPPGKITSGEIWYHPKGGQPVNLLLLPEREIRKYRGRKISMIFQEPMTSLNPVFTCGFQVDEAIRLHLKKNKKDAREHTIQLFRKVQLPDPERAYRAYPHELSGGQKQRVMIAMAMSCDPDILIADEPTTALDVTVQKAILQLMAELKTAIHSSIVFITHDLGVIAEIADRVLVMYKGKIVEQGHVLDIFEDPQHPYTKGLLACRPPLDKRLRMLPVVADFMEESDGVIKEKKNNSTAEDPEHILLRTSIPAEETESRLKQLTAQEPILRVLGIKTWFPVRKSFFGKPASWVKAVDDVSFDVYPGETLGLVGESGCGKTTLGRTIIRLTDPVSGEVYFKGRNLMQLTQRALKPLRKDIQIIFQDPYSSLNPRMTVGNAIMEPMQVHHLYENDNTRRDKTIDLLEKTGLKAEHFNRYPHEFSGGQRQRVCIARALAVNPQFIICDESVSALDVSVQAQVLNLLMHLRNEFGLTYIFISHDLSVVRFMSDRMIVMNQGKIEESGPADAVCNTPRSAYTRKLIEAIPKGRSEDIRQRFLQVR